MLLRFMGLRPWTLLWGACGILVALVTAFGGGSFYVLMMKPRGEMRFGWQDPLSLLAALAGFAFSLGLVESCQPGRLEVLLGGLKCGQVFTFFDCINNGILIAWGTSKSFLDCRASQPTARLLWGILATYAYSFGGGITRDLLSRLHGEDITIGNFSLAVVVPAIVGMLLFHCILLLGGSPLLQLGLGLPSIAGLFYIADYMLV